MVAAPTRAQLLNLRPGRDSAVVFPPRSEPDQWGEAHCPFPVRLAHETTEPNPPLPCATSSSAPAYKSPIETVTPSSEMLRGQTYTHHHLRSLLRLALTHLYGATVAALYPRHSFRSRIATALHAANVPDSMIMLMCRWMSPESSPCPSADGDPRTRATDQLGLFHERRRHPTCQPGTCGWRSGVGSSLRRPAARPIGPCERLQSNVQHRARHATPWSSQPTSGRPTLAESSEAQDGRPRYAVSTHRLPRLLRCRTDARRSALQNGLLPLNGLRVVAV